MILAAAYQLTNGINGAISTSIIREVDGAIIPNDPNNADWQKYQVWLKAGNVPDPAPIQVVTTQPLPVAVAIPNNANAKTAGVSVGGQYTGTGDPAQVFIRTV